VAGNRDTAMPDPGPPQPPPTEPAAITRENDAFPHVPGYRFQRRLGKGGMATVYLATQQSLDRPVAIKVMSREALRDEVSKQRFENEARTIARLAHPGIVGIHEVGRTDDGRMYYVMPYLANGDLSKRDLRGDEARVADVLRALLAALGQAHARGIVHRDVKRENVLFDAGDRPLLTDFGIATQRAGDVGRLTSDGLALGSSGYMAPEQARGVRVDARADLYSVGVLAYELLTGKLPFEADDGLALALMHSQDPVPRLPPALQRWQAFIDKAMAKAPDERFADAQQMRDALDRIASGEHGVAAGDGTRSRLLLAGAALLLLVVIGIAVRMLWSPDVTAPPVAVDATAGPAAPPTPAEAPPPAEDTPPATPEDTSAQPDEPAPTEPTPAAPDKAAPPPATAPAPAKHPTLSQRARNTKDKVKRWFRRH
jgi:tRNA A-37 threonylcarbamoyl transferase component Bud32